MPDVNDVLMGRVRAGPGGAKRKRTASSLAFASFSGRSSASPLPKARRASLLSSISSSKPATKQSPSAPPGAQQTYIDVGQRSFGERSTCGTCGLLYTVGEAEDEKDHAAFCKRFRKGITVSRWKNERLHKAFPDANARIIEIRADDPAAHVNKLREIKALLDDALGLVEEDAFLRRGHFVYVADKQVVGCVTVESVARAVPVDPTAPNVEIVDGDAASQAPSKPVLMGVCQIWVHPSFRRQKIASRLLDVVRDKFIYGMRIPANAVAFAQPTQNGLAWAAAYVAPHAVLVYDAAD